ncbi:MAG TPA: hypothetical protein VNN80_34980 [Polyangiaceae bacterium]|jgi:hypothetical protein|nr:hypothetical protein [Polyangiaceae bacterium]
MTIRSNFGTGLALVASVATWSGCSAEETRRLTPVSIALAETVAPIYDDGELTIYEAKTSLDLPIIAPSDVVVEQLWAMPQDPFERRPWITSDDVEVQVNWTLSNLDEVERTVWVMIDPHNEFGRYEPALVVTDDEAVRDLSGIDMLFLVPGVSAEPGAPESRITGTFTFDDMDELAHDFATVFKILRDAIPADPEEDDPRGTLINYAFNVRNRSYNSPLLAPYQPAIVPGLVGFDFGVRTSEPANVALEIVVELRDRRGDRVAERGQTVRLLEPPEAIISGGAP